MPKQALSVDEALARAATLAERGERAKAINIYRAVLAELPDHAAAMAGLERLTGPAAAPPRPEIDALVGLYGQGRLGEALERATSLARQYPDAPALLNMLGVVNAGLERHEAAMAAYTRALQTKPDYAAAHSNLGNVLQALGKHEEALASYDRALRIDPGLADAHCNLSHALTVLGRFDEAVASAGRAVELKPGTAEVHYTLGNALKGQGRYDAAAASYAAALRIDPRYAEAHANMGSALISMKRHEEAIASLDRATALKPDLAEAHYNRGLALTVIGRPDEAAAAYQRSLEIRPSDQVRFADASILPVIYRSTDEVERYRNRLIERMARLLEDGVQIDPVRRPLPPPFYLAYQGRDNRALLETVGRLCAGASVDLAKPDAAGSADGRISVGFLSAYFTNHTVGEVWRGLIAQLSRTRFSVTVLSLAEREDAVTRFLRAHSDRFIRLAGDPAAARRTIADERLDILFYLDIGMTPSTWALAVSRLAPVQCVTWGHPVTSGLPTIDYYISSDLLETDGAESRYTEELVRLRDLGIYYHRPELPASRKSRSDFGLPEEANLYGCLQSLFKFHPDFDALLAGILRADPEGRLVIPAGQYPDWTATLLRRFDTTLAGMTDRVVVIERQKYADFTRLTTLMDALLLPPDFGGGKTSYDALAQGLPIVTMPSAMLPGRITYALYRKMGVMDCVAETPQEYVDIAVRLGTDPGHRAAMRQRLLAASDMLFEDMEAVREVEDFLVRAAARARARSAR